MAKGSRTGLCPQKELPDRCPPAQPGPQVSFAPRPFSTSASANGMQDTALLCAVCSRSWQPHQRSRRASLLRLPAGRPGSRSADFCPGTVPGLLRRRTERRFDGGETKARTHSRVSKHCRLHLVPCPETSSFLSSSGGGNPCGGGGGRCQRAPSQRYRMPRRAGPPSGLRQPSSEHARLRLLRNAGWTNLQRSAGS